MAIVEGDAFVPKTSMLWKSVNTSAICHHLHMDTLALCFLLVGKKYDYFMIKLILTRTAVFYLHDLQHKATVLP